VEILDTGEREREIFDLLFMVGVVDLEEALEDPGEAFNLAAASLSELLSISMA